MAKQVEGRSSGSTFASSTATGGGCTTSGGSSSSTSSGKGCSNAAALSPEESERVLREIGFSFQGITDMDSEAEASSACEDSEAPSGEDTPKSAQRRLSGSDGVGPEKDNLLFNGLRRRLISPLDIHFSQAHIRPEFQDGRKADESAELVETKLLRTPLGLDCADALGLPPAAPEAAGEQSSDPAHSWWLLKPPFPEIEVIRWRCKLRKEDGTIKTDETGLELYGPSEWYTLDNRRLYCLQKAATKLYPQQVRCSVIVIKQEEGNCREFRKFRTPDLGRSVRIGHRDSGELPRWNWRLHVGLPEAELPQGTAIASKNAIRRRNGLGRHLPKKKYKEGDDEDSEEEEPGMFDSPFSQILLFMIVYMLLRIVFHIGRHFLKSSSDADAATSAAELQAAAVDDIGAAAAAAAVSGA